MISSPIGNIAFGVDEVEKLSASSESAANSVRQAGHNLLQQTSPGASQKRARAEERADSKRRTQSAPKETPTLEEGKPGRAG